MTEENEHLAAVNLKNYNKTPLDIVFHNVTYGVTNRKKEKKVILNNVSGKFSSGKLTAILGPSGAGKTSLLNILAGKKRNEVSGKILINGQELNRDKFQWQSSYIEQETSMLPLLTTRETLSVAAKLKLSSKFDENHRNKVISEIIDLLNLDCAENTKTCNLSGGELKRLSIGVELITNPPVMFFDEPTSGLDSISSVQVIAHLQNLAKGGRTIVCVIHQPSSRIFDMFDELLVISSGRNIYGGPVAEMVPVFESYGFAYPKFYNRAEFALEVATYELKGDLDSLISRNSIQYDSTVRLNDFPPDKRQSKSVHVYNSTTITIDDSVAEDKKQTYAVSQWTQFLVLFKRSNLSTFRDLQLAKLRVVAHIAVGLLLGLIYYGIGDDGAKVISNSGLIFFFLLFIFFGNAMPTVLTFPMEANVFQREYQNNWYSLFSYFSSKIIADFPLQILCPTLFLIVAYYLSGQPSEFYRFCMVLLVCIMFAILSQLIGLIFGSIFNMQMGIFLTPSFSIPMLIFSGFLLHFEDVPYYLRFLTSISYFGYGYEAIILALYDYDRAELDCSTDFCYIRTAKKFLTEMDMTPGNYVKDVLLLEVWIVILQIVLFVALIIKTRRS